MRMKFGLGLLLLGTTAVPAFGQAAALSERELTGAARELTALPFDSGAPITVRGRILTMVWPKASDGMIVLEVNGGLEKFAFSTGKAASLKKVGFTRASVHSGEEIVVTGVPAGGRKIKLGFIAARADVITKADGTRLFDRAKLGPSQSR